MDPIAVIVLLVLMFTVAAVIVAGEDGRSRRGEAVRSATSRTGELRDSY